LKNVSDLISDSGYESIKKKSKNKIEMPQNIKTFKREQNYKNFAMLFN